MIFSRGVPAIAAVSCKNICISNCQVAYYCTVQQLQPSSRVVLSVTDRVFLNKPIASNRNELKKMFIISLGNSIELESTPRSQAVRISEYGRLNQPITAHVVVPERSSEYNYVILCILEFRMNVRLQCIQEIKSLCNGG